MKAPTELDAIQAIEREYAFKLPAEYIAHLLVHTGGWPTRKVFLQTHADGTQTERRISEFKSVSHGPSQLERSLALLHDQPHPLLVPFASEAGGDPFVLSVGHEDYGSVYYVSHETIALRSKKNRSASKQYGAGVLLLAPSFTAFLSALTVGQAV